MIWCLLPVLQNSQPLLAKIFLLICCSWYSHCIYITSFIITKLWLFSHFLILFLFPIQFGKFLLTFIQGHWFFWGHFQPNESIKGIFIFYWYFWFYISFHFHKFPSFCLYYPSILRQYPFFKLELVSILFIVILNALSDNSKIFDIPESGADSCFISPTMFCFSASL